MIYRLIRPISLAFPLSVALSWPGGCTDSGPAAEQPPPTAIEPAAADPDAAEPTVAEADAATTAPDPAVSEPASIRTPASLGPQTAEPAPHIAFVSKVHDYGEISDISDHVCRFEFTNTGDAELVILDMKAGCGCTIPKLQKTRFQPGEESSLQVTFNPRNRRGEQSNFISIMTNAPSPNDVISLNIKAHITPFLYTEPQYLALRTVKLGEEHKATFTVSSRDPDLLLQTVKSTSKHLSIRRLPDPPAADADTEAELPSRYAFEVTLHDDVPWGAFVSSVSITATGRVTENSELITHTARVSVIASVYGEIRCNLNKFHIGTLSTGESFEKTLQLTRPSGEPFSIISTSVKRPTMLGDVTITAVPMRSGVSGYDLVLAGTAGNREGFINGLVEVITDIPGEERLKIQFGGRVLAPDN